ncbi:hypothetical protein D1818_18535 [Aquimarina sp. BL5]|uniref:hypothetical protein n=1 Tax=Aquimarina sp. BL5 TaxID=1714860 RepID=UPI000E5514FA|nr:hypothetical protein [Aquimarina sp. BL5]AXT52722.1 hypothetical protein D1818_18535 [Aquimarina sp. BL5]RKN08308.1 hypothetical protein D7036_06145 [Aquimarina sp. BL5]
MKRDLLKISLRQQAVFIPENLISEESQELNQITAGLVANAAKLGFGFSEDLLKALNTTSPTYKLAFLDMLKEVTGVHKNWTPLVKGWDTPTNEDVWDHIATFLGNVFKDRKGKTLPCGHLIPENTFPLERYNGCPFCGTPFEFSALENFGQGSKLKVLELWTKKDLHKFFIDLLSSKTVLDATQVESLQCLLNSFSIPKNVTIGIKETSMLVIDALIQNGKEKEVQSLLKNPNDILRYLWYKHTGFLQIIEPKTIIKRAKGNSSHIYLPSDKSSKAKLEAKASLKLKYTREECKRVAGWINALEIPSDKICETMHPKRGIWVRMIRALRLAEYSKRKEFDKLAEVLDIFYNETYEVWQGYVNHYRLKYDAEKTFELLKQRPGLFARSLFSNMLWFGADITLKHFNDIVDKVPARLIFTLNMYAKNYFDKTITRAVKPLGGTNKMIPANKFLQFYTDTQLKDMQSKIEDICIEIIKAKFANSENENQTVFIDEALYKIPLAIGDRSETVQDLPSVLMGTRFPLEGDKVRLFMQWGTGLKAQHLDMDLSCTVSYEDTSAYCSYSQLTIPGCKHSGDIINIPEKVGTAEYIEIDVNKLSEKNAKYVTFTCNAYSNGSISPNLVVGWMDSKHAMRISQKTGVAYDPSCVIHQVRITQSLTKGLVFGILDVKAREIVWLEMSYTGQIVQNLDMKGVEALLTKLDSKLNIGYLLELKAEAQNLEIVSDEKEADEVYTRKWAINAAAVTQLFID